MHLLITYTRLADHPDPLFSEFTYGDLGNRGRRLKALKKGTYVFFHTSRHGKKYITAYYVVDRVMDLVTAANNKLISDKYKNPHILEYLEGERENADDV